MFNVVTYFGVSQKQKKLKKWKKIKKINEKNIPKRTGNYCRLVEKDQNIQDWKI